MSSVLVQMTNTTDPSKPRLSIINQSLFQFKNNISNTYSLENERVGSLERNHYFSSDNEHPTECHPIHGLSSAEHSVNQS